MLTLKSVPGGTSGRAQFRAEWIEASGPHPSLRHLGRKLAAMYEALPPSRPDARLEALGREWADSEQRDRPAAEG